MSQEIPFIFSGGDELAPIKIFQLFLEKRRSSLKCFQIVIDGNNL